MAPLLLPCKKGARIQYCSADALRADPLIKHLVGNKPASLGQARQAASRLSHKMRTNSTLPLVPSIQVSLLHISEGHILDCAQYFCSSLHSGTSHQWHECMICTIASYWPFLLTAACQLQCPFAPFSQHYVHSAKLSTQNIAQHSTQTQRPVHTFGHRTQQSAQHTAHTCAHNPIQHNAQHTAHSTANNTQHTAHST
jgi:hypothetical protein